MRQAEWYVGIAPTQDGTGYPELFQGGAGGTNYTRPGGWGGYERVHGPYRTERQAAAAMRALPRGGDVNG